MRTWRHRFRTLAGELAWFLPSIVLLLGIVFYPILRTISLTFMHQSLATGFQPEFAGLDNFVRLAADSRFRGTLATTGLFTFVSVAAESVLGLLLALSVNSLKKLRNFIRVSYLVPWTLPTAVIAVLWTWIFADQFGVLNTLLVRGGIIDSSVPWLAMPATAIAAIVVADVWKTTPFVFLILLAGLQNIPQDLYEAMEIDGAGAWTKFRYVTWPHLLPFVFVAVIFRIVQAFAIFDLVWVMTGGGPGGSTETISVYTYQTYMRYLDFGYGSTLAFATVATLAVVAAGLYWFMGAGNERTS